MKKIIILLVTSIAFACGGKDNEGTQSSDAANSVDNVEENSGDNISPQLEDSANRLEVDTVKSATGAQKQKNGDLDN